MSGGASKRSLFPQAAKMPTGIVWGAGSHRRVKEFQNDHSRLSGHQYETFCSGALLPERLEETPRGGEAGPDWFDQYLRVRRNDQVPQSDFPAAELRRGEIVVMSVMPPPRRNVSRDSRTFRK